AVEVDDRVERERADERDAPERRDAKPVEGPALGTQAEPDEEGVERAVLSEDLLDADGADEGREDHRHEHDRGERGFAGKLETVAEEGERQADGEGEDARREPEPEGVEQAGAVERIGEQRTEGAKGEVSV